MHSAGLGEAEGVYDSRRVRKTCAAGEGSATAMGTDAMSMILFFSWSWLWRKLGDHNLLSN
jgi:hypothetical protein